MVDLPTIPQSVVDFSTGAANAVSFGLGNLAREGVYDLLDWNDNVNQCSDAYSYGEISSLALGVGRLAYSGLAKAGSLIAPTARSASNFRNGLKSVFRGGLFPNFRKKTYDQLKKAGKSDSAIRASSGRTNSHVNTAGAQAAAGGAIANTTGECGCNQ